MPLHESGEYEVLRMFARAQNATAAEVTPALGCDPEVNHYTEVLRCDDSMQEDQCFWQYFLGHSHQFFFFGKPRAAAAGGLRRRRKFWGMLLSSDHFY